MLSQRKKYNYNITPTQTILPRSSRHHPSSSSSSAYKSTSQQLYQNQNINVDYVEECSVAQSKRIVELENANKRMLEETTKQFQKFQADVVKVEGILRVKEQQVERLELEAKELNQDKAALIEALKQKQSIILQFHDKLKQLISQRQSRKQTPPTPTSSSTSTPTQTPIPVPQSTQTQTEPTQDPQAPTLQQYQALQKQLQSLTTKYEGEQLKNEALTEEVYRLKQEVYEVSCQLGLVKQEYETGRLLQEIEEVRRA